jgi:dolichyl-phosphate-mannose-protein mannosyltransferase
MYSTSEIIIVFACLLFVILTGIYLCKYSLKYAAISILGLALLSLMLPFWMGGIIDLTQKTHQGILSFTLHYCLPIGLFCIFTIALVRWAVQRHSNIYHGPTFKPAGHPQGSGRIKLSELRHWFAQPENMTICAIAAILLAVHLLYIARPNFFMGDEGYYVPEANRALNGLPFVQLEHPPLAKWLIAIGIFLFGDNAVGWRIIPILFGTASIFIFYLLCQSLVRSSSLSALNGDSRPRWFQPAVFIPVAATFLFAADNFSFTPAHIAELDVFSVTLMLAGFLFYTRKHYLFSGIALGLSILCKETALLGLLPVLLHWGYTRRHEFIHDFKFLWSQLQAQAPVVNDSSEIIRMGCFLAAVPVVWMALIPLLDFFNLSSSGNLFVLTYYIYWYNMIMAANPGVTAAGLWTSSPPWQWIIQPTWQDYNLTTHIPRYLATIGWTIWPLIIPAAGYLAFKTVREWQDRHNAASFVFIWLFAVYGLLIIAQLLFPRPMYSYYFYPAIPAVCFGIALTIYEIWQIARKRMAARIIFNISLVVFIIGTIASFVIMSPLGTNLVTIGLSR